MDVCALKFSKLIFRFANISILVAPSVPGKSAANSLRKLLLDASGKAVGWIFVTWSMVKVQFLLFRQCDTVVEPWFTFLFRFLWIILCEVLPILARRTKWTSVGKEEFFIMNPNVVVKGRLAQSVGLSCSVNPD